MANRLGFFPFDDLRGGRNGVDSPLVIPPNQCADAVNIDFRAGMLGRKRDGAQPMTSLPPHFTSSVRTLFRHLPGPDEGQQELWAVDQDFHLSQYSQWDGTWTVRGDPAGKLLDNDSETDAGKVQMVSFNDKLFMAYGNSEDRLHVWDGFTVRKTGLSQPEAPFVGENSGTGITGTRFYKIAFAVVESVGGVDVVTRRSELSPATSRSITNKGGWRVQPAGSMGEGETHWEVYAGTSETGAFYKLALLPNSTIDYVDSTPVANFPPASATLAPLIGSNANLPSAKYLLVDEARLLLANSWKTPQFGSRVWWTPILREGSLVANDERLDLSVNPYIDFDPGDGGEITGLAGPLYDSPYVFKFERIYKMTRTGVADAPYRPVTVTKRTGAINQRCIVLGEDETGNECLYFLSRRGPYRLGVNGLQYCGRDIEDLWAMVSVQTAKGSRLTPGAHAVYVSDLRQVWFYVPTGSEEEDGGIADLKLVFDVRLGQFTQTDGVRLGWARHRGPSCRAWCSCLFADEIAGDGITLTPYVGQEGREIDNTSRTWGELEPQPPVTFINPEPVAAIWFTTSVGFLDNGIFCESGWLTRGVSLGDSVALHGGVIEGHVVAKPTVDYGFAFTTWRDFGLEERQFLLRLNDFLDGTAVPLLVRYVFPVRDLAAVSAAVLQVRLQDFYAPTGEPPPPLPAEGFPVPWVIDQLLLRVRAEEDR